MASVKQLMDPVPVIRHRKPQPTHREIALNNLIFQTVAGSRLYGLHTPDSDTDTLGLCIEPPEYVIGLRNFEQYDGKELNGTIYSLRKYVKLILKGNPTVTEILYAPKDRWVMTSPIWDELRAMAPDIISRETLKAYVGYLRAQRERLLGQRGQKDIKRPELVDKYGYDTKFAMHAVRLGKMGLELSQCGNLRLPFEGPDQQMLMDVRNGKWALNEVVQTLEVQESLLKSRIDGPRAIPDEPDYDKLEEWVVRTYRKWWEKYDLVH